MAPRWVEVARNSADEGYVATYTELGSDLGPNSSRGRCQLGRDTCDTSFFKERKIWSFPLRKRRVAGVAALVVRVWLDGILKRGAEKVRKDDNTSLLR